MEAQPELKMFTVAQASDGVARLAALLQVYGWLTRKQITAFLGWDERTIRAVAAAAGGGQIVCGQRGFNLVANVPVDELVHCANQSEAQAVQMQARALAWRKAAHAKVG